jgi:hypothetical protein
MSSIASPVVTIETTPQSVPSTPSWLGEVAIMAHYLSHLGLLEQIAERVRFARARFGIYDVIDFVVVLIGYALSGEATLQSFYERLLPFATPFLALFAREQLPSRSALSRFLKALDQPTVESLRSLFQEDLQARPLTAQREHQAGLQDRCGRVWEVCDADGTRQAARQRALPHTPALPPAHRRLDAVCAAGYTGRKRGEVVRTRTTLLLAHTQQWVGTYGNAGNGEYRGELLRVIQVLRQYACKQNLPLARILLRLDGQYGDMAVVIDLVRSGLCFLTRGKDYGLLDLPVIQARLQRPPDEVSTHPETGTSRALFDCPALALAGTGLTMRVIVATHPVTGTPAPIGLTRDGVVYELFFTALPPVAFTAADVVDLYLHRGAFETVLCDEDQEQHPDRWVSHTACGQEFWHILSQWMWNLRLELGHRLHPTPVRMTEMAAAFADPIWPSQEKGPHEPANGGDALTMPPLSEPLAQASSEQSAPLIYGPPEFAQTPRAGKFAGTDFEPQPDGTLRCPANHPLYAEARRPERDGTVRVLYAARLPDCRGCAVRHQCQGSQTKGPRRVSAVVRPVEGPSPPRERTPEFAAPTHPILWSDWSRRETRRALIGLLHTQTVTITTTEGSSRLEEASDPIPLTRQQRAHWRLSWAQRLARNARSPDSPMVHLQLFGIPTDFALFLGLPVAA